MRRADFLAALADSALTMNALTESPDSSAAASMSSLSGFDSRKVIRADKSSVLERRSAVVS